MSKYIIDIPNGIEWGVVTCRTEDGFYTRDFDSIEELNSDYINEHYGELQDEAYKRGYDDGKKSVEDEGLRNNINLIVTQCGYSLDEINDMIQKMKDERQ